MKKDFLRYIVVMVFILSVIILLIINAIFPLKGFWCIDIGTGIEMFILIYISYYLVQHHNEINKRNEKIYNLISKIQEKIIDVDLINISNEETKQVTRVKLKSISSLLEIVKKESREQINIDLIIHEMDTLSSLIMDHIDDNEYIKKSHSQIVKLIENINVLLEKSKFDIL